MPPFDFDKLAKTAFRRIKKALGTPVTYKPKKGGEFNFKAVFDDRAQEVDPDTERPVSSNAFTLGIQLSDIPFEPEKGDTVIIKQVKYRVENPLEDGVPGVSVVLFMHRVGAA